MSTDELRLTVAWFATAMPGGPAYGDPETTTWGNFASIFSGSRREGDKGAYQESCVRGHSQPGDGLGETHDHTQRAN
jgi:hypothetical protein